MALVSQTVCFSCMARNSTPPYTLTKRWLSLSALALRAAQPSCHVTSLIPLAGLAVLAATVLKTHTTARPLGVSMAASFTSSLNQNVF